LTPAFTPSPAASDAPHAVPTPEQELINAELRRESQRTLNQIQRPWSLLTQEERLVLFDQIDGARPHRPRRAFVQASAVLRDFLARTGVRWPEVSAVLREPGVDLGIRQILECRMSAADVDAAKRLRGEERRGEERRGTTSGVGGRGGKFPTG
jgi:hypothetical protein